MASSADQLVTTKTETATPCRGSFIRCIYLGGVHSLLLVTVQPQTWQARIESAVLQITQQHLENRVLHIAGTGIIAQVL
jgi:hypothetical protein